MPLSVSIPRVESPSIRKSRGDRIVLSAEEDVMTDERERGVLIILWGERRCGVLDGRSGVEDGGGGDASPR